MTSIFQLNLDSVETNQRGKYLGVRSFSSKVTVRKHKHTRQTHETHTGPFARPGPLTRQTCNKTS